MFFELLDTGQGYKLERWGQYCLSRPDPQIIWEKHLPSHEWERADAIFSDKTRSWQKSKSIPDSWVLNYQDIKLLARLTPFKHTGIFPEQADNWVWMREKLKVKNEKLKILNLFGYTGGATMVLARAGHMVTHVDASKPAIAWAKENQKLNNLPQDSIRWIFDDAAKFVNREVKRGQKYEGILMDPPAFGHSPSGKVWKFNKDLPSLLAQCLQLLSTNAQFLLINGYATNSSAVSLKNLLEDTLKTKANIESGELFLSQKDGRQISTGIFARWHRV